MKIRASFIIIAVLFNSLTSIFAIQNSNQAISLNNKENTLTAHSSQSYQWFHNDKLVAQGTKVIKVNKAGKYTLVTTDENGNLKSASVNVGIDANGKIYTIYLIGDSTVSEYGSAYYPLTGWGQVLKHFFNDSVIIQNKALGGRSAKSFYNDHWQEIVNVLQADDYVFIGFGINDNKADDPNRYSEPFTTFKEYLTNFVNETKAKGAHPVLVSTVRRNSWNNTNPPTVYDAWHDYPVATRQLAGEINVPLIDLDQLSVPLYEGLGPEYVGPFMYLVLDPGEYPKYIDGKGDNVHFQEMGAIEMAKLVIEAIESYSGDTIMNRLIPHIQPRNTVSVSTNFTNGAIITRSTDFPQGLNITIKARMDPTYDFLEWQDGSGTALGTNEMYMFEMGDKSLEFKAILDDSPTIDCTGEPNGSAFIDDCGDCAAGTTGILPCATFTEDTYRIISVSTQKCIQDNGFISPEACSDSSSQAWILEKENNNYRIKGLSSGNYMYYEGTGSRFVLSTDELSTLWRIEKAAIDTFQIIPADNTTFAARLTIGYNDSGDRIKLLKRTGESSQEYLILPFSPLDCTTNPEWCATSVNNINFENIKLQPNPFSNTTRLIFENHQEPISFSLYDLNGKEIFSEEHITENEIVFGSELLSGFYIGHIVSGAAVTTIKIIKR